MSKLTSIEKELILQLRAIWDDFDFVISILSYLKDDVERKLVFDFIKATSDVTPEQITLLALNIEDALMEDIIIDDFNLSRHVEIKNDFGD